MYQPFAYNFNHKVVARAMAVCTCSHYHDRHFYGQDCGHEFCKCKRFDGVFGGLRKKHARIAQIMRKASTRA